MIGRIRLERLISYKFSTLEIYGSGVYSDDMGFKIIDFYGMTVDIYISDVEKYFGIKYNRISHNIILKFIDKDELNYTINLKETLPYDEHYGIRYKNIDLY